MPNAVFLDFYMPNLEWCHMSAVATQITVTRLFNSLFSLTTKKHQRSAYTDLCEGNPPVTGGIPP